MTKYHIRPRIVTTVAAFALAPALAFARAGSGSPSGSPGSHEHGAQGSQQQQQGNPQQQQGSQQQGSQRAPSAAGDTSGMAGATDKTRAAIDPSVVQRVFGMDAALVDMGSLNTEDVKRLQQSLKDRGHYPGQVDGVVGPQTRAGLNAVVAQQFALTRRLINQGQITGQLAESMGLEAHDITPVTGIDTTSPSSPRQPAAPSPGQTPSSGNPVYPEGPLTDDSER